MSKSTNTVVYFDWKTVIYIYVCGKCCTQFILPMEKLATFTRACANEIIPSINRSFVYKAKEGRYVRNQYHLSLTTKWNYIPQRQYYNKWSTRLGRLNTAIYHRIDINHLTLWRGFYGMLFPKHITFIPPSKIKIFFTGRKICRLFLSVNIGTGSFFVCLLKCIYN
jgi:hypothetical protein